MSAGDEGRTSTLDSTINPWPFTAPSGGADELPFDGVLRFESGLEHGAWTNADDERLVDDLFRQLMPDFPPTAALLEETSNPFLSSINPMHNVSPVRPQTGIPAQMSALRALHTTPLLRPDSSSPAHFGGSVASTAAQSPEPTSGVPHRLDSSHFNAHPSSEKLSGGPWQYTRMHASTVSHVYMHDADAVIEYPHTDPEGVAHVFRIEPTRDTTANTVSFENPLNSIVYSRTKTGRASGRGCRLFTSVCGIPEETVKELRISRLDGTCAGAKICAFADPALKASTHSFCTPDLLRQRVAGYQASRGLEEWSQPSHTQILIQTTLAIVAALQREGCSYRLTADEAESLECGYDTMKCPGDLVFFYDKDHRPVIRFHSAQRPGHRYNTQFASDCHLGYLEALMDQDTIEIARIEGLARTEGYGPLASCSFVTGTNAQRLHCPVKHRTHPGAPLLAGSLQPQSCKAQFIMFSPEGEDLFRCPFVIVVCKGVHSHPIPLPTKTPPFAKDHLLTLLGCLGSGLADITPRRLMRNGSVQLKLKELLPHVSRPTLADLHPSFANHDHLAALIAPLKTQLFPFGTDFKALKHQFDVESALPPEQRYIRRVSEVQLDTGVTLRFVLCMSPAQSKRCLDAVWQLSDTTFKRAPPWLEFVIGGWDHARSSTDVYCRVFCDSKSAEAHCHILLEIDNVVHEDTGSYIKWRHIDSQSLAQRVGRLGNGTDLDVGQVKGYGLHHIAICHLRHRDKYDLHEPERLLIELEWWEHAQRSIRACDFHVLQTIENNGATDTEKAIMRSMLNTSAAKVDWCVEQLRNGSQAARDWLAHKINSKFILAAICQEKSYIPADAWAIGDRTTSLLEGAHADMNLEGKHLSLLAAIERGRDFDLRRSKGFHVLETSGIASHYDAMTPEKRYHRKVKRADRKASLRVSKRDSNLQAVHDAIAKAQKKLDHATDLLARARTLAARQRWEASARNAHDALQKLYEKGKSLPLGTGRVLRVVDPRRTPSPIVSTSPSPQASTSELFDYFDNGAYMALNLSPSLPPSSSTATALAPSKAEIKLAIPYPVDPSIAIQNPLDLGPCGGAWVWDDCPYDFSHMWYDMDMDNAPALEPSAPAVHIPMAAIDEHSELARALILE